MLQLFHWVDQTTILNQLDQVLIYAVFLFHDFFFSFNDCKESILNLRLVLFLAHHQHLLKIGPHLPSNRLMSFDASLRMLDIFVLSKTVKLSYKIFMVEVFLKVIVVVVLSFYNAERPTT